MRKFVVLGALVLLLFPVGCGRKVSKETAVRIRDQHALYHVYVKRKDDDNPDNDPTPAQDDQMVRNALTTFEALDREVNNWEPSGSMGESNPDKPDKD